MIAVLRQLAARLVQALQQVVEPVWRATIRITVAVKAWIVAFLDEVRERHRRRVHTDPSYPVALATGGTAAIGVLVVSPALAAAIGLLLTEWLGASRRPSSPYSDFPGRAGSAYGRRSWDDDGPRLWDRDDWDDQ